MCCISNYLFFNCTECVGSHGCLPGSVADGEDRGELEEDEETRLFAVQSESIIIHGASAPIRENQARNATIEWDFLKGTGNSNDPLPEMNDPQFPQEVLRKLKNFRNAQIDLENLFPEPLPSPKQ